jgi:hypothetical protein
MNIVSNVKLFISELPNQTIEHKNLLEDLKRLELHINNLITFSRKLYEDNNKLKKQQESNYIKLSNLTNLIDILRSNINTDDDDNLHNNCEFDPSNLV